MNREILNIVNRVLSEELTDKYNIAKRRIFEGKDMCEQCGAETNEGECKECGYSEGEVYEKKLTRLQKRELDMDDDDKITAKDFKYLRRFKAERKGKEGDIDERLYGKQYKLDKNKNNKIDAEDFKMLRGKSKTNEQVYSVIIDGSKFIFNESEMVDVIENIVLEEKKKKAKKKKAVDPIKLTKNNIEKSGKENKDYIDSVVKKMKDYIKDGSKGSYDMNPDYFPKGNGELAKMPKKAYMASDAVGEYIDNFTAAGLENLDYDEIHPNDDWVTSNIEGSSKTGNNPKWGNSVETPTNKKRNKIRKDNLLGKLKRKAYNKSPQPVVNDSSGDSTDKASKLMLKLESKETKKVISEIDKMKDLMGYSKKTQ